MSPLLALAELSWQQTALAVAALWVGVPLALVVVVVVIIARALRR